MPENTNHNYQSQAKLIKMALNDIKKFLDGTEGHRLRIAHIRGAHGSGKSTKAVPVIWQKLHREPNATLVYIQATEAQTVLLRKYLLECEDSILADSVRDGRFKLWSFTAAVAKLLKGYEALNGNTVVCLDLDVAPTAYGEFLLACVIERAMQIHSAEDDHNRWALFTLGAGEHRYPTMEPFRNPVVIDVGLQRQIPEPALVCGPDQLNDYVIDLARTMKKSGQGIVLSFLNDSKPRSALRMELSRVLTATNTTKKLRVANLGPAHMEDPSYVDELLGLKGYILIQVDPSITTRLPFRHVHAIFYSLESKTQVLDGYTGLYLWKTKLTSRPEVAVFRSYTAASPAGGQPTAAVLAFTPEMEGISEMETPRSRAYGSQLPLMVLLAYSKWRCGFGQMPLAYLDRPDDLKWLEGAHLLKAMGLLAQTGDDWVSTPMAASTVDWLPHAHDWRIACLLGHIKPDTADLQRRVIIRLAAIIEHEIPIDLGSPMSTSLMKAIGAAACGPAASMVDYGEIWVALSLWELARRESDDFTRAGGPPLLDGRIRLRLGRDIYDRVASLERVLKLQPATIVDMDTALTQNQIAGVEKALADAWCSNMFWISDDYTPGEEPYARCFANGDEISMDTEYEAIYMDGMLDDGGCLATALIIRYNDERLEAASTVLLNRKYARFVHETRMGGSPNICDTFRSLYAHCGRDEK